MTSAEHQLAAAREAMRSMEAQLADLYEEKARAPGRDALEEMVESLNAQVCTLLDEKAELERQLAEFARPTHAASRDFAAAA